MYVTYGKDKLLRFYFAVVLKSEGTCSSASESSKRLSMSLRRCVDLASFDFESSVIALC